MKLQTLRSIIEKKKNKSEFAIITNLSNGESEIFEKDKSLSKEMQIYSNQINEFFKLKKNGVIENSEIFVETYVLPIKVIVVGAVHIAQYLVDFSKSLNFEISIIDPRGYFASEQRFPEMKIINKQKESMQEFNSIDFFKGMKNGFASMSKIDDLDA